MSGFQQIYEEYGRPVYRFLLSLAGDPDLAEELLQETFYKAFLHINRFEGRSSLYSWLCQIGKNAWLKECGRKNRYVSQPPEELSLSEESPSPEEEYIRREEKQRMRKAVLSLEEPYRDVFILHVYGGLKLKEIAQTYQRSESWARVTFYRAKQMVSQEVLK